MRPFLTLLHRWFGLTIAGFLIFSGLTGAVISWDHELDEWLNPHLHERASQGPALASLELARQVEARDPRVTVSALPLAARPGETLAMYVQPRRDPATGRLYEPGYNEVFVDPTTGAEIGRREWGQAWPITRETVVSFLYKLHYSLHLPEMGGIDRWGIWLLGGIAVLWTIDCFTGFYLTLPVRRGQNPNRPAAVERQLARGWWRRWKPAWKIKTSGSAYRVTFDLHRAFSLWTWALLFVVAFTAFSLNLYREVFLPVMSQVSHLTPTPFMQRKPNDKHDPIEAAVPYERIVRQGRDEAARRGWSEPLGGMFYNKRYGIFSLAFYQPGDDHGAAGVGPPRLYYDGRDGRLLGDHQPWVGTAADIFVQAQFPVHSGRILGLPGRILISIMGLVVALLSVTGVVIWWRKRAARVSVRGKTAALPAAYPAPAE
ncbi:PepSY-associated TM helix domain-containing protein [uncultured Methylobacterium sp.]|uniref:PepSY-associated TM helix domain-containing protein n=1 Tax=uncultured Methylobacterium sp. TaxID=157278 RepID=UPI0035CAAF6C